MSEPAPEISHSVEPSPKSGSLTALRKRLGDAVIIATRTEQEARSDGEKEKALKLRDRHMWQLGMLDSLVTMRMVEEASTDSTQTERQMSASDGVRLLTQWIEDALDNPNPNKDPKDMPDEVARKYAEDLLVKLSDEATSYPNINTP